MLHKKAHVKIKPSSQICEYLHNLSGYIIKTRKKIIMKRTKESNWNPKKIKTIKEYCIDLTAHSNTELNNTNKRFWLEEQFLECL